MADFTPDDLMARYRVSFSSGVDSGISLDWTIDGVAGIIPSSILAFLDCGLEKSMFCPSAYRTWLPDAAGHTQGREVHVVYPSQLYSSLYCKMCCCNEAAGFTQSCHTGAVCQHHLTTLLYHYPGSQRCNRQSGNGSPKKGKEKL